MIKKIAIILAIITILSSISCAEWSDQTDLATDAFTLGIGSIEGFSNSASNVFQNPGSLYSIDTASLSAFHTTIMDTVNYSNLAIAFNTQWGNFGLGAVKLGVSEIPFTSVDQYEEYKSETSVDFDNSVYFLTYTPVSEGYHIGYTLKYFASDLGGLRGTAFNADIGAYIPNFINNGMNLSITAKNILNINKYKYEDGSTQEVPSRIVLGLKQELSTELNIYSQLLLIKTQRPTSLKAVGIKYSPEFLPFLSVYSGWREHLVGNNRKDSITYGLGLTYQGLVLAYAYEKTEYLLNDDNHYVSVAINI